MSLPKKTGIVCYFTQLLFKGAKVLFRSKQLAINALTTILHKPILHSHVM